MNNKNLEKPSPRELAKYQKLDIPIHPEIAKKFKQDTKDHEDLFQLYKNEIERLNEELITYTAKVQCHIDDKHKTTLQCLDILLRNGCRGCPERTHKISMLKKHP